MLRCPRPRPRGLSAPRSSVSAPLRPAQRPNSLRTAQQTFIKINIPFSKSIQKKTTNKLFFTFVFFMLKFSYKENVILALYKYADKRF